jgi:hypothetical protein
VALVGVIHFAFSSLSKGLMYLHQKTLSIEDLRGMQFVARIGDGTNTAPREWTVIAGICGAYSLSRRMP